MYHCQSIHIIMTRPDHWPGSGGCWQERWQRMTGGLWWHSLLYSPHSVHSQSSLCYPQLCSPLVCSGSAQQTMSEDRCWPVPAAGPGQGFSSQLQSSDRVRPGPGRDLAASDSGGPGLRRHGDQVWLRQWWWQRASDKHAQLAIGENGKISILVLVY